MNGAYAINGIEIWHIEYNGNKQLIGYIASEYEKVSKTAELATEKAFAFHEEKEILEKERDEYYNMLLENNLIKKPKTQDEINEELFRMNEDLSVKLCMAIDVLNKLAEGIKGDDNGHKQNSTSNEHNGSRSGQSKNK
ncbi:MAG: hypothetical protein RR744_00545 [Cellulosilyticaceae bacterium]